MILTNTKIQTAIIKAWYSIALKSIKYYGGLAIGINNSCLLKQVRLLRAYVDILKCFKIVGSTPTCNCHIEGDYTVELVDGVEITSSPIQFGCNNQGYLVYNGTGYPFTYYYDSNNSLIQINFTTIEESITLEDVQFTDNCNITNGQTTQSPIEMTEFEVTGTPVIVEGYDGSLVIVNGSLDVIYTLVIPYNILNDPEAIVNLWNNTYGNTGFLLSYNGSNYIFTSPLDGNNYFGWGAQFNQYEGGIDSFTTFINPLTIPSEGTLYWGLVTQLGNFVVYQDNTPFNYTSLQEIVDAFNNGNNQGFTATLQGSDIIITSPENSFDFFNGDEVELAYTYESEEYEDYNTLEQFSGGEQPEIVTYEEFFAPIATIGDFINDNPCEPETVEQYCLSNKNIISIIKHIDRIVS